MAAVRGKADVARYMAAIPGQLQTKVLRGAARAAAKVVAAEARDRSISEDVSANIKVSTSEMPGRIVAKVSVAKGWARSVGIWLEYGTAPHFISVDASQRAGRSVGRINRQGKDGSLVIAGAFVGDTVFHPGARPHPFLRVSLDVKEAEAIAAAQSYISSRVSPGGIAVSDEPESEAA